MMKGYLKTLLALTSFISLTQAAEYEITQDHNKRQKCNGVYSKAVWGGSVDPFIVTTFEKQEGSNEVISFVIYEWHDEDLLGIYDGKIRNLICNHDAVAAGYCNSTQMHEVLLQPNATDVSRNPIHNPVIHLNDPKPIHYSVNKTGYYCIWTDSQSDTEYRGVVEFRNAYGELPAAQIAKLPFYGGLTLVYAVVGAFWAFLYVQNRHDILPVQNYITAIIIFLIVEQSMTWGFYDYQNRHGNNIGTKVLLVITSILNAGRNSFSFFLLLIVCMGYGVVKPSLGKIMTYVRILALAHFVFGVICSLASLSIAPESTGPLILLAIMPLAATMTAFYVWTLNSLSATMKDLIDRKQTVKALMYKRLWWCILGSIVTIFAFFFFNSFTFASTSDPDFAPNHWKTRWFILDGWLSLVYLFDICFVAYLWRPTANNRRFAMSDEIAQDEDGNFEISSLGGPDEDDEEEVRSIVRSLNIQPAPGTTPGRSGRLATVAPKHVPGRHSLDGETIFAVGEDGDKWSDDEEEDRRDSQERTRLTK